MAKSESIGKCYDCKRRIDRRNLQPTEVPIHHDDGGYDWVPVPMCPECQGERYGWDCPICGIVHSEKENAKWCCDRHPAEAPDCIECGRRMERGSWGYSPETGHTVDWAKCEACNIGWGSYTGWHDLNESKDAGGE